MLPVSWNGSSYIYQKAIRPFVIQHQSKINEVVNTVREGASEVVHHGLDAVKKNSDSEGSV